jgi:HPt (histidine-containing phosphotransfer) domain-containing protein
MNENNKLIQLDYDLLDSYINTLGITVIEKMFALYRQQVAIYLVDIESSLQSNNEELWKAHCHKMKGAASSIGLVSLHEKLALMEKTSANINEKNCQLIELIEHNQQALTYLEHWFEQYNSLSFNCVFIQLYQQIDTLHHVLY